MEVLIIAALLGVIPAMIADSKGRSFLLWWFFGAMLFIVALPAAILMKTDDQHIVDRGELRKCPMCAELIKREARVCRYCGRDVEPMIRTDKETERRAKVTRSLAECPWCGAPRTGVDARECARCGRWLPSR